MKPPSPRRIAVVFLQAKCNMTCTFCATDNRVEALSLQDVDEVLSVLKAGGVQEVIFGGGEPFAWTPGVLEAAARAKAMGLTVQIGTNGLAMPEYHAHLPQVDRYILPLEASQAEIHDWHRRAADGHHAVVMRRLEELGKAGKSVTLSTVVMRSNHQVLGDLAHWIEGYQGRYGNVHAWHLYRLLPIGRGGAVHEPELATDYDAACAKVRQIPWSFPVLKRPDMLHSKCVGFYWREAGEWHEQAPFRLLKG